MTFCPFTHSLTPSSAATENVYVSLYWAWTLPVHRAEKPSTGRPATGAPVPQSKLTLASVRVAASVAKPVSL